MKSVEKVIGGKQEMKTFGMKTRDEEKDLA